MKLLLHIFKQTFFSNEKLPQTLKSTNAEAKNILTKTNFNHKLPDKIKKLRHLMF